MATVIIDVTQEDIAAQESIDAGDRIPAPPARLRWQ